MNLDCEVMRGYAVDFMHNTPAIPIESIIISMKLSFYDKIGFLQSSFQNVDAVTLEELYLKYFVRHNF